jgi:hypothetical protein
VALTTDSQLAALTKLADCARSLKGIDPSTMRTIMLPMAYDKKDLNRVIAAQPQAHTLWQAVRTDSAVPVSATISPTTGGD